MHSSEWQVKGRILAKAERQAKPLRDTGFAKRLNRLAEERGVDQPSKLGRLVGVPSNTAGQWLRGDRVPRGYEMGWLILELHLNVSELEYLVGKSEAKRKEERLRAAAAGLRVRTLARATPGRQVGLRAVAVTRSRAADAADVAAVSDPKKGGA